MTGLSAITLAVSDRHGGWFNHHFEKTGRASKKKVLGAWD
jgi:hypothetical protein